MKELFEGILRIQYFQFKIINFDFRQKKFVFGYNDAGELYAINSIRNNIFSLIFYGGILCLPFNLIFVNKLEEVIAFVVLYVPVFAFCLRKFLWLIRGYERITISSTSIIHEFVGSFWMKTQIYKYVKIKDIWYSPQLHFEDSFDELKFKVFLQQSILSRIFFYRTVGALYLTHINKNKIRIFSKLSFTEKEFLFNEINKRFENQSVLTEEIIKEHLFSDSIISNGFSVEF